MDHRIKKIIKKLPVEISLTGIALLMTIASRGALLIEEMLTSRRGGLIKSLHRIDQAKDFGDFYNYLKNLKPDSTRTILWRLQKKGLVKKKRSELSLTSLGEKIAGIFDEQRQMVVSWDKKWRIFCFDIPETKRKDRKWLAAQLFSSGYKPLQKSVFFGKFPLEEDLMKLIIKRGLYQHVRMLTVGEIDDESILA